MTIAEQLRDVRAGLAEWAQTCGASVEIAADAVHLWHLLKGKPGAVRALLLFESEQKRGEYEETGRVDRKFLLILSRGRGFTLDPADNLVEGSAGGLPMYDVIESARDAVRALNADPQDETGERLVNYQQTVRVDAGELRVDAYQIEFSLAAQMLITNRPETRTD